MSTIAFATNFARGVFYAIPAVIAPENNIASLIRLGNTVSKSRAFHASLREVQKDPAAKSLIDQRYSPGIPSVKELLEFPEGSLGFALGAFLDRNEFTPYPTPDMRTLSREAYFRERWREIHDILHVVWGYETTLIGEACINIHMAARTNMPMCLLIPIGVILKTMMSSPRELVPLMDGISSSWRKGMNGMNPIGVRWEELFDRDLQSVREMVGSGLAQSPN